MFEKLYQKDLNTLFFYGMITSIWALIVMYAALFAFYGAWGATAVMLFGTVVIMPIVCFLEFKKYHITSRLIYNMSCSFYVLMTGLSFQYQDSSQYYYSCVVIGALSIFSKKDKLPIFIALTFALSCWMGSKFIPLESIPHAFFAKDAPIEFLSTFNEIGSFFLTLLFIYMFTESIGRLKDETVAMNDLVLRTEEHAKIGSWAYDVKDNSLKWSDQTYRIHEVEVGSVLDVAKAIDFYHVDYREKITKYFTAALENGASYNDVFKIITARGNQLWVRARGRVSRDDTGAVTEVSGSFQDITEEKKAQDAKDEFLAMISHEMRTPLMSVIGLSDLMKESNLDKEQEKYTDAIIDGGQAVLTIINDVLDLSKIKDKALNISQNNNDLIEVVNGACNVLQQSASAKDLKFEYSFDITNQYILCDKVRLRQIITNLVSNAIKFTDSGSVTVNVKESKTSDGSSLYSFLVSDTGCGMSEEFLPIIFDEFLQDDQGGNLKVGTGLGMSITKKLVDLMGGEIEVQSEKGKGTSVSFEISFKHGEKIEKEVVEVKDADLSHFHILYADDNKINQKVVSKLLKSTNCKMTIIENGQLAMEEYQKNPNFDVILMDLQMPVMDGLSATKKIREIEKNTNLAMTPVLAFSAFSFEEDIVKAKEAGCNDYINKPARKKELIEKILNWQKVKEIAS
jgi:PAS domain S-box-containing protein